MAQRLVVGDGSCKPADIAFLAIRVVDHVCAVGLPSPQVKVTRNATGFSRYLTIRDHGGRDWLVRLSNHYRPRFRGLPIPHFDLVSHDGVSGEGEVRAFISGIAAGALPWTAAEIEPVRARRRA